MGSLDSRVKNFWNGQHTSGHNGLVILHECIQHVASKRDWDALSRFVSRSGVDKPKITLIIRAAFGDQLIYEVDKKHVTGGRFKMKWEGEFPLHGRNTYGLVEKAIQDKKSFRSADFLKELREAVGKPAPKPKDYAQKLSGLVKYLQKQLTDTPDLGFLLKPAIKSAEDALKVAENKEPNF